jgi:hypothetical protein
MDKYEYCESKCQNEGICALKYHQPSNHIDRRWVRGVKALKMRAFMPSGIIDPPIILNEDDYIYFGFQIDAVYLRNKIRHIFL